MNNTVPDNTWALLTPLRCPFFRVRFNEADPATAVVGRRPWNLRPLSMTWTALYRLVEAGFIEGDGTDVYTLSAAGRDCWLTAAPPVIEGVCEMEQGCMSPGFGRSQTLRPIELHGRLLLACADCIQEGVTNG